MHLSEFLGIGEYKKWDKFNKYIIFKNYIFPSFPSLSLIIYKEQITMGWGTVGIKMSKKEILHKKKSPRTITF